MTKIALRGITKRFGTVVAVDDVDLEVGPGEFVTLLGPSGCGKTTALRILAGFATPDAGAVLIDGRPVQHLPPEKRPTAMVFQSYALWPHKTVAGNIAFGLRMLGWPRREIGVQVDAMLDLVGLPGYGARYPRQLSGGQRQRVALARALAVEPQVLLLDEPLSSLDALLRVQMRDDIRALQRRLFIAMVFVTHDQQEALSMSDRIAVMNHGRIEQLGTPRDIYDAPSSLFVAAFMGRANFLSGTVADEGSGTTVRVSAGSGSFLANAEQPVRAGEPVVLSIKAEKVTLAEPQGHAPADNLLPAVFSHPIYLGATERWVMRSGAQTIEMDRPGGASAPQEGQPLLLHLPPVALRAFPGSKTPTDGPGAVA